ncbi:MAG TPA: hypothetical protein DER19_04840 [Eubacterium sp.]|nr:hypothetical protein [Eubacterium sp.]
MVADRSDKLRGIMKNNLKVLFIQLCVLAIGCFIGEAVFGLPKWLGLVIAGLMFYLVFFIIQIKGAMSNIKDEVSSDGIAGARICGVFISAMLLAFIICGVFSVFACLDIAPCTELCGVYRAIGIIVWILVILWTLPPDTWLARFATNNYKRYEDNYD